VTTHSHGRPSVRLARAYAWGRTRGHAGRDGRSRPVIKRKGVGQTTPLADDRPATVAMSTEDRAAIGQADAEDARRSRTRQGLPERIEDPAAVAILAAIVRDTPTRRAPSERTSHERTSGISRKRRRRSPRPSPPLICAGGCRKAACRDHVGGPTLVRSYVVRKMQMRLLTWANDRRMKSAFWLHAVVRRGIRPSVDDRLGYHTKGIVGSFWLHFRGLTSHFRSSCALFKRHADVTWV
jgi:hypothetical protein